MSDILQAKTITGEYSGFADSALRAVSSTFLTAHQSLPSSANWDSTYTTVSTNSASWTGGGGTTYTSPSGTIRINGDTLEGTNSAIVGDTITDVVDNGGTYKDITLSALPNYPYSEYLVRRPQNYSPSIYYVYYDNEEEDYFVSEDYIPPNETISVPFFVAGGYPVVRVRTDATLSAIKGNSQVVELALKSDLVNYQTTAGMTAYQPSGDYYSASNPSGFITALPEEEEVEFEEIDLNDYLTAVPAGTMNESAFAYDASNNITAYNGSAFKAGDEFPQSATEAIETVTSSSAIWNDTTDTVSSNSGAWGGSALPISAGPGIKVNLVDNTLVFSNDETVLWTGNHDVSATSSFALSESPANFEYVEIYGQGYPGHQTQLIAKWYTKEMTNDYLNCVTWGAGANAAALRFNQFLISSNNTTTINVLSARQFSLQGTAASTAASPSKLIKIVGINHL